MLRSLVVIFVAILCGCPAKKPAEEPPKLVETLVVKPGSIAKKVRLVGTVKAVHESRLIAEVAGTVSKINAADGQRVKENHLIAELKSEELTEGLELAKKATRIAEGNEMRMKKLYDAGDVSKKVYEDAENALIAAKGAEKRALMELKKTKFTAPFTGVLSAFKVHKGAHVSVGEEIVSIYDPSSLFVELNIPEDILTQVKAGQELKLKDQSAKIDSTTPLIDPKTHMGTARAKLAEGSRLSIGGTIEASLEIERHDNALVLPREAVFLHDSKPHVVVIKDGVAKRVEIKEGLQNLSDIEVLSGISDGDVIVGRAPRRINDGEKVRVSP